MTLLMVPNAHRMRFNHAMRWRIHIRALVQFLQWNKDIEPAREDEADGSDDHDEMRH
ncbi:MAG: hypothetical protein LQ341_007212, partial [Variospora aurantia]